MENILSNMGLPSIIKNKKTDAGFHKTLISFNLLLTQDTNYGKKCKMLRNSFGEVVKTQIPSSAFMAEKLNFYSSEEWSYFRRLNLANQAYRRLIYKWDGWFIHWWSVSPGNLLPWRETYQETKLKIRFLEKY